MLQQCNRVFVRLIIPTVCSILPACVFMDMTHILANNNIYSYVSYIQYKIYVILWISTYVQYYRYSTADTYTSQVLYNTHVSLCQLLE